MDAGRSKECMDGRDEEERERKLSYSACRGMRIRELLQRDAQLKANCRQCLNKLLFTVFISHMEDKRTSHTLLIILNGSDYHLTASLPTADSDCL